MKTKLFSLISLTFFLSSVVAQNKITDKLIGKWEAKDAEGVTGSFNFIDNENVILTIPGQALPKGNYTLDTTKSPIWLDINIRNGNKIFSAKGLLKLIDDNTLKCQIFNDSNRPNDFADEKSTNTILLKRKAESSN